MLPVFTSSMREARTAITFEGGLCWAPTVVSKHKARLRITIRLDDDVIEWFRDRVERAGGGNYQSLINEALRDHMGRSREPLETTLRRVIREEIRRAG